MAGAIVQSAYAVDDGGGGSTTIAATLNGVTAGNHLIAHVGWSSSTATCSVSDGTAYSTGDSDRDDTNQDGQVFYLENAGAGSHTITATLSTSQSFRRIRVCEVSGLATSSSKDQATGQAQSATTSPSSSASAATTNANDFVMGFTQNGGDADPGSTTLSAGATYTLSGSNNILGLESKSVAATGAQTATFGSTNSKTFTTHVIAFKEAGGGGTNPKGPLGMMIFGPLQRVVGP